MKNLTTTKKLNNCIALVVMMALLVTSIGVLPIKAEGTFTFMKSTPVPALNSVCYAKDYITVMYNGNALTENVDYNYGTDTTALDTSTAGSFTWQGTVYGMGSYAGTTATVSLFYRVSQPVSTTPTVPTTPTVTTPVDTGTTTSAPADNTTTPTTQASTGTEKPIEGEVTFKKFMEKYCNYGVYEKKNGGYYTYTIGKISNSGSLLANFPCSPKYQYYSSLLKYTIGSWNGFKDSEGNIIGWDGNYNNMASISLPARLWSKYTAAGDVDAINCMLDDFEKLPMYEKQLHIGNFTYGQILKSAEKVGRTVTVEVLPLKKYGGETISQYTYGVNIDNVNDSVGVYVTYNKTQTPSFLLTSNIGSALRPLNKLEVIWKCKGDKNWRTGNCGTMFEGSNVDSRTGRPMGKGNVYTTYGKQTRYWKNVTEIRIRQYRTINSKNYYTDWLTIYKNGKEVNKGKTSTATTSSNTKAKVKNKTVKKGKKVKVKVSYSKKQKIKWTVSNKKVVKIVKKSGKGYNTITIKGKKAGKATITGKGKGKTFKIKVTVKKK